MRQRGYSVACAFICQGLPLKVDFEELLLYFVTSHVNMT